MAYFFGDGFDLYALPADAINGYWDSGTTGFALGSGRFANSRAIVHSATGAWLVKSSGANDAIHHIVCAYQQTAAISGATLGLYFQLTDASTNQCCIVFRSDGAILLTSATPAGTVLATYTGAVTAANTWYAFEFEVVINNTTGSFTVRKNGNTSNDFTATALNTRPGTNNYANKLTVGSNAAVTGASFDDVLWRSDAASVPWVGDIRCYTRMPASDVSVAWSQSGSGSLLQTISGGASSFLVTSGQAAIQPYICSYPGTITSFMIATASGAVGNIKGAVWADNAGVPGALLASVASQTMIAGNNVFTLSSGVSVTIGQRIWIGACGDTNGGNWNNGPNSSSATLALTNTTSFAAFPQANPTTASTANRQVGSYINYLLPSGNFALVQEAQQDSATTYVYSSTVGQTDRYGIASISGTPGTVLGVTTRGYFQKSDAGTRNVAVQLTSGATTVESTSTALNTTWGWIYRTDLVDPATSAAWTATGVNNATIGATVTA